MLLRGYAVQTHIGGQTRQGLGDAILYTDSCGIGIDARGEGDCHLQASVGTRNGLHVHDAFDGVDRFFQRNGD